jgi:LPS sulfotransferase NodH
MNVRLLLSTQRSGSHFLKSHIESHFSGVTCSGEVLREPGELARRYPALPSKPEYSHFWPWYETQVRAGNLSVMPDKRLEAFEIYLSKLSAVVGPGDLVVDVKYNSIRSLGGYWDTEYGSHDFTSFITSRNISVLHLIRKNILKVIVSNKLAVHTGVWHRNEERSEKESLPKIRLNPKRVLGDIRYALKLRQDYQTRFSGYSNYDEIVYEDFVQEQGFTEPGINSRVLALFLEKSPVSQTPTELPFKKTTPDDPSEVVENWQEVIRFVRTTEHGWMTDTPYLKAA